MYLETIFRQFQPDCDYVRPNRSGLWNIANSPWHIDTGQACSENALQFNEP